MSCNDCFQDAKKIASGVAIAIQQAKALAIKCNCNVYIFKTEEGYSYMVEEAAIKNGIQPTAGIISPLQPTTV